MALFGKKKTVVKDGAKDQAQASASAQESMQDLYKETAVAATSDKKERPGRVAAATILVKPLVTEKATNLSANHKYVFVVSARANKISVAQAIKSVYGVKPLKVNLINMEGKSVSRGRISGRRRNWRKAIVTLAKTDSIKIYEGV